MLYHFGQYTLDPDRLELRRGGQLVDVEPQVFLLLLHLIANRDRVVSKDELLKTVWGSRVVSDATLNTRINAVRRAVGDSGKEQKVVRTFPRRGFRFVGEVSEEEGRPPAPAVAVKSAESKDDDQTEPVDTASAAPDQTVGTVDSGNDNQKKPVDAGSYIGPTEDSKTEGNVDTGSADEPRLGATGGERRHLTVMVCELVVSPDLSEQLDPEDFAEVTVAYHNACRQIIADFDGFLASARSTTILAYFGYPQAHEDDAERSIRAALRIVDKVGELKACEGTESSVKVGIATGVVVASDTAEGATTTERLVLGQTPNVAADLQALAQPSSVLIADSTRQLVEGMFVWEDLGPVEIRDFTTRIRAYRVYEESDVPSRFEAAHGHALTRFVGRQSELHMLLDRWGLAKVGEGQVVMLSGEAGIGKSRIAWTLRDQIRREDHVTIQYQCFSLHVNSPLYPVIQQLEFAAGFKAGDTNQDKLDKLEQLLQQSRAVDVAPLMAALLSISAEDRYAPLGLTPQDQKLQTLQALVQMLEGLAVVSPILFLVEDVHWIDPTTQELLDLLIDRVAGLRVLMLVTHRPGVETGWTSQPHCTLLTLNRLGREACADLIDDLAQGLALPEEVFEQIISKTEGVPLFVNELTKTVLASELLVRQEDRYVLSGPLPSLAIPSTLQDSLTAQLDRLDGAKEIAQIGAAIGREIPYKLLQAVARTSGAGLDDALDSLIRSGILFLRIVGSEASYVFKHALIQDAAYDSLLRSRRQQIHARIAEVLQTHMADRIEKEAQVLAYHYTQAGLLREAAPYWLAAGQRAVAYSANLEAIAHLTRGTEIVAELPAGPDTSNLELDMQISLGSARIAARGYSSVETEEAWLRARQLLDEVGEDPRQFAVLHGLAMVYWNRAEFKRMEKVNKDMLQRAPRQNDDLPKLVAARVMAVGLNPMGRFEKAREYVQQATELYDPERHRDSAHRFGHDQGVGTYWHLAIALLFLGYPDTSAEAGEKASAITAELQNANTTSYDSLWGAFTSLVRRDWDGARAIAAPMIEHAGARSMALWAAFGRHLLGSALAKLEEPEAALEEIYLGRNEAEKLNNNIFKPMTLRFEAQALSSLGRHEEAVACLDYALELIEVTDERWWESDIHRVKAQILWHVDAPANEIETGYKRAMAVAGGQNARLLELRSAVHLGDFWREQGRREEARDMLSPIYNWFDEGFETPDLKDAKWLLDKLS